MKKLFILSLFLILTGCVTYYYPETALEDGVYYAEDDPSYVYNSGDYSDIVFYPWLSLDYFYLGYNPYPVYGFVYGYPAGWGYSPWHYPYSYYGHYPPRYLAWDPYPYWRPYRGKCMRHGGCQRNDGEDRYAEDDHENRRRHYGDDNKDEENIRNRETGIGRHVTAPVSRYVSTAPSGYSGNQGMVYRNRETRKIGKSRLEPTQQLPANPVRVTPVTTSAPMRSAVSSTPATRSGNNTRSPSFSSPSTHHRSRNSRSPGRKDRD